MRLQLIAIAAGVAAVAGGDARAQTSFSSKIQVYVDDDHTEVVSPTVQAEADVGADTHIAAGYLADVISSASVDVVSQASPATIHDVRHQVSATASHQLGPWNAAGGYTFSAENDYTSHVVHGTATRDLFDKATTLGLGYALSLNTIGRAHDDNFSRSLTVHTLAATWTQIVNRKLITQVSYELSAALGYQASAYRFVPVRMDPDAVPSFWVPETDPDQRFRHAVVVGANLAVFRDSAIQGDYRFYRDTWGIVSHTFGARYFVNLTPRLELRLRSRLYTQSGASFYQANYTATARYMTFDRELGPLWSETLGGKLMWKVADRAEAELKLDGFYYRYYEFPALPSRLGANVGLGLSILY